MIMLIQNHYMRLFLRLVLLSLVIFLISFLVYNQNDWIYETKSNYNENDIRPAVKDDELIGEARSNTTSIVKDRFEYIYKHLLWSEAGGGSGTGSSIKYTESVRTILRQVVDEYSIESMIDAPCGSFHWMPLFLRNVSEDFKSRGKRFRYHGVDVVDDLIKAAKAKYSNESDWEFSVCDFSAEDLPNGYELIFSRDALQHLPYEKILDSLKAFSRVKGAKYLLVGSYLDKNGFNKNIRVGEFFRINLIDSPFNLKTYIRIYDEHKSKNEPKSLILYDIPNYLSKIDFDLLKAKISIKLKSG